MGINNKNKKRKKSTNKKNNFSTNVIKNLNKKNINKSNKIKKIELTNKYGNEYLNYINKIDNCTKEFLNNNIFENDNGNNEKIINKKLLEEKDYRIKYNKSTSMHNFFKNFNILKIKEVNYVSRTLLDYFSYCGHGK